MRCTELTPLRINSRPAFEQKRDAADAITELEQFLKEEPEGQRADIARKELAAVRAIPH
jgi:hypothetical protein